jgi:hypothetical protein
MSLFVTAAVITGGASIIGSSIQANAQDNAANTQQNMFNTITGQEQPFLNAGYGATSQLNDLLGTSGNTGAAGYGSLTQPFNPTQAQLNAYPGYQFALNTGAQATRNADTPGVGALSGPALKDLTNFDVGAASQNYQNYYNNSQTQQTNIFNRLNSIAGLGQNAAGNLGNAGTSLGTGIAQAQAAAGSSIGAGVAGAGSQALPVAYLMSQSGNGGTGVAGLSQGDLYNQTVASNLAQANAETGN